MTSIFTQISTGEIPGEIIYEDDRVFVIPDIEPISTGHLLVIPREEVDSIWDLDEETYSYLWQVARKMAIRLHVAFPEYKRIATAVEGFGVPHAHIHVFGVNHGLTTTMTEHATNKKTASPAELKALSEKLRATAFSE